MAVGFPERYRGGDQHAACIDDDIYPGPAAPWHEGLMPFVRGGIKDAYYCTQKSYLPRFVSKPSRRRLAAKFSMSASSRYPAPLAGTVAIASMAVQESAGSDKRPPSQYKAPPPGR